jgi:hypothetical protein
MGTEERRPWEDLVRAVEDATDEGLNGKVTLHGDSAFYREWRRIGSPKLLTYQSHLYQVDAQYDDTEIVVTVSCVYPFGLNAGDGGVWK